MPNPREEQLQEITTLSSRTTSPGNNSFWIHDGYGPTYTDSEGNDFVVIASPNDETEVWVSDISGNDDNDGSQGSPFKTIAKAVEATSNATGEITVHLAPHSSEEGYDFTVFSQFREWSYDRLTFVGDGYEVIDGPFVFESHDFTSGSEPFTYNFSNLDGYFTPGEFDGYFLTLTKTSTTIPIGLGRSILHNNEEQIMTPWFRFWNDVDFDLNVGDEVSVTKPTVKIKLSFDGNLDPYSDDRTSYCYGPISSNKHEHSSYITAQRKNVIRFKNVEFRFPNNTPELSYAFMGYYFIGNFEFIGCMFTSDYTSATNNHLEVRCDGHFWFGVDGGGINDPNSADNRGWGASFRSRSVGNKPPSLEIVNNSIAQGTIAGSILAVREGSVFRVYGGAMFDNTPYSDYGYSGSVEVINNSLFEAPSFYEALFFKGSSLDANIQVITHSQLWIYSIITHFGNCPMFQAKWNCGIQYGHSDIIIDGGADASVEVLYNSQMRILDTDAANLGACTVGYAYPVTRPAGAWAPLEYLIESPDVEKCSIYRRD